jgi:hypothetical protein
MKRRTQEEIAKLKRMAQEYSGEKIAEDLGRGFPATRVKAHQLGLSLEVRKKTETPSYIGKR